MIGRKAVVAVVAFVAAWSCTGCGIYCRHLAAAARDAERRETAYRSAAAEAHDRIEADLGRIALLDARIKRLQAEQTAGLRVIEREAELEPKILELREGIERAEEEEARRTSSRSALLPAVGGALPLESCRIAEDELVRLLSQEKRLRGESGALETRGARAEDAARGSALLDVVGEVLAVVDLPRQVGHTGSSHDGTTRLLEAYVAAQASLAWDARRSAQPGAPESALHALALRSAELLTDRSGGAATDDAGPAKLQALAALARTGAAIASGVREDADSTDGGGPKKLLSEDPERNLEPVLLALQKALDEDVSGRDLARLVELQRLAARAAFVRSAAWSSTMQHDEDERMVVDLLSAVGAIVRACEAAHPVLTTVPHTPERFSAPPPIAF